MPRSYAIHKATAKHFDLRCEVSYNKAVPLYKGVAKLHEIVSNAKSKLYMTYELELDYLLKDVKPPIVFDKTRIKSLSETPLVSKELRVRQILPLISIDGLLYVTNKRIYF